VIVQHPFDLAEAGLGRGMSLVVVDMDYEPFEVKTSGDAADYLEYAWDLTLAALQERELVAYSPEVIIRTGEERAVVVNEDLREENEVVAELLDGGPHPKASPAEISGDLYLYAVVSDTPAGCIAMIKKKNPTKRARAGRELFGAGDELHRLDEDPWELHPLFDMVIGENGGYALNTTFFEQLFADADRLRQKIRPWARDIAKQLPMSTASRDTLVERCDGSARMRRRLRAIIHRGHINRVDLASVRRHVKDMGLSARDFATAKELVVTEDNVEELLRILNEDLTRGGLTHDPFRIESKEPM
jgi:hypothetical protein